MRERMSRPFTCADPQELYHVDSGPSEKLEVDPNKAVDQISDSVVARRESPLLDIVLASI